MVAAVSWSAALSVMMRSPGYSRKLQPRNQLLLSDIDRYFDSPRVSIDDMKDPNWLCLGGG